MSIDENAHNGQGEPATVLVVDDQVENLKILDQVLSPHYLVRVALSGEEALRVAAVEPIPDLILLDVAMPGLDGYQVCEALKADPLNEHIPIIFLTAMAEDDNVLRGFELGAVDYISKPFNPAILLARVKTHLRLGQHEKLLFRQANIDLLTLLPNRRRFESSLAQAWRRACRRGEPLGLILVGADRKNDVADDLALILEEAGQAQGHSVFQYDEGLFAVLMENADAPAVEAFADALQTRVAEERIGDGEALALCRGAASVFPSQERGCEELVELAGRRLAEARAERGDCR